MGVFKKIAESITNSSRIPDHQKDWLEEAMELQGSIHTLISYSEQNPAKRMDITGYDEYIPYPDITGEDANLAAGFPSTNKGNFNYYTKTSIQGVDRFDEMTGFNIAFARKNLGKIDDGAFTKLFEQKLWNSIHDASSRVSYYSSEDLFYYFAGSLQRLIDPKWKTMVNLDYDIANVTGFTSELADDMRFESLKTMVPDVFRGYVKTHDDDAWDSQKVDNKIEGKI